MFLLTDFTEMSRWLKSKTSSKNGSHFSFSNIPLFKFYATALRFLEFPHTFTIKNNMTKFSFHVIMIFRFPELWEIKICIAKQTWIIAKNKRLEHTGDKTLWGNVCMCHLSFLSSSVSKQNLSLSPSIYFS